MHRVTALVHRSYHRRRGVSLKRPDGDDTTCAVDADVVVPFVEAWTSDTARMVHMSLTTGTRPLYVVVRVGARGLESTGWKGNPAHIRGCPAAV